MSISAQKRTACIALLAMLFGAVSPAMAALLFADRPQMLRRMLALPAPVAAEARAVDDGCPHEAAQGAHHGPSNHDSTDGADHAAHGIFCSLCLTASSVVTLLTGTGGLWAAAAASGDTPAVWDYQPPPAVSFNFRPPRGPPAVLK